MAAKTARRIGGHVSNDDVALQLDFGKLGGIVPAIVQDAGSLEVLMLAYMNRESLNKTEDSGYAHYYSRSRERLWKKGESSGHVQRVREIRVDCDEDAVLLIVDQRGPACHTGNHTCFYREGFRPGEP